MGIDGVSMPTEDAEKLFEHLSELQARLPQIEAEGEILRRAQAAAELEELDREAQAHEQVTAFIDRRVASMKEDLRAARARGDEDAMARISRRCLFLETQRGYHLGPAENGRRRFSEKLESSVFSDEDEMESAIIEPAELATRLGELRAYAAEYLETLERCAGCEGMTLADLGVGKPEDGDGPVV